MRETSLLKYVEVCYKGESLIALQYKNKVIIEYDPAVWQDTLWVDGCNSKTINKLIKDKKATGIVISTAKADFSTQDEVRRQCNGFVEASLRWEHR